MTFLLRTISSIYSSVKGYFIKEEKAEDISKAEQNFENFPSSIKEFDEYIQHLKKEMQEERDKVDTFKVKNDDDKFKLYESQVKVRANEICIIQLDDIKQKSEQNLENSTNVAIYELEKRFLELKEEYKKVLSIASDHIDYGNLEVYEYNVQMKAIEICSIRLSKIKSQLEKNKNQNQNIEIPRQETQEEAKQENKNDEARQTLDEINQRIKKLQEDIKEAQKNILDFRKAGNESKAKEWMKKKKIYEASLEKNANLRKFLIRNLKPNEGLNQDLESSNANQSTDKQNQYLESSNANQSTDKQNQYLESSNANQSTDEQSQYLESYNNDQSTDDIFYLRQSYYQHTQTILNIKLSPHFDKEIDEEYENLDVTKANFSSDEDEKETIENLMKGYT